MLTSTWVKDSTPTTMMRKLVTATITLMVTTTSMVMRATIMATNTNTTTTMPLLTRRRPKWSLTLVTHMRMEVEAAHTATTTEVLAT